MGNGLNGGENPALPSYTFNGAKRERSTFPVYKKDFAFGLLTFLASLIFIRFSFFGGFNLGFTLSYFVLLATAAAYLIKKGKRLSLFSLLCGIFALLLSAPFTLYSDGLIKFVSFAAIALLTALFLGGLANSLKCSDGSYMLCFDAVHVLFLYPITHFTLFFRSAKKDASENGKKSYKQIYYIAAGSIIAIPFLAVIIPLLMSSDAAFEVLVSKIFGEIEELLISAVLAVIVSPLIFACLFALGKGAEALTDENALTERSFAVSATLINTVLTILSGCYAMYLFSQSAYFFSAFAGLLPQDYTAAEYARRGFFEMCAVAAINLGIFFAAYILEKRVGKNRIQGLTKGLLTFLTLFTLVLISTSFSKMYMYIERFGLTRPRVLTSCFMILIFSVFVTLLLKLYVRKLPYMKIIIILTALTLCAVSYTDIDTRVAKYNTERYFSEGEKEIDIFTILELSDAKIPYLIKLYENGDTATKDLLKHEMPYIIRTKSHYNDDPKKLVFDKDFNLISFNLTDYRNVVLLEDFYGRLIENNDEIYKYWEIYY